MFLAERILFVISFHVHHLTRHHTLRKRDLIDKETYHWLATSLPIDSSERASAQSYSSYPDFDSLILSLSLRLQINIMMENKMHRIEEQPKITQIRICG